jgi:hypothetical protein
VLALGIAMAPGVAVAGGTAKPKVDVKDPCTLVSVKKVRKAFGKPVEAALLSSLGGATICEAKVGADPAQPPGGIYHAEQYFPNFLVDFPTATAAVEDRRAFDTLSDNDTVDVNRVGRKAYLNRTTRTLVVAATKKFGFSLTWLAAGETALSRSDEKKLIALAKDVVNRAP